MASSQKIITALRLKLKDPLNTKSAIELLKERDFELTQSQAEYILCEVLGRFPSRDEIRGLSPDIIGFKPHPGYKPNGINQGCPDIRFGSVKRINSNLVKRVR